MLGACVPHDAPPAPTPAPVLRPVPALPPPPAPAPPPADWQTGPLSPGDWRYTPGPGASGAEFRSEGISFAMSCIGREIAFGLSGTMGPLIVRTSFGERRLPPVMIHSETLARLPASDSLFDQMAFSRGRFLATVEGGPWLAVPAWPEIGRVIEDCRGQ